jgi:hypothetical protein
MDKKDVSEEIKIKVKKFLSFIDDGFFVSEASRAAGLLLSEVEQINELFPKLGIMIQEAEGKVLKRHLDKINNGERRCDSSRWFIERRFRKNWSPGAVNSDDKEITPEMALAEIEYIDAPNINDRLTCGEFIETMDGNEDE